MKNTTAIKPMSKKLLMTAILAGTAMTACQPSDNSSRSKDIVTDLGRDGVTYYYKIEGDTLVRARCQQGRSTPSFCQEDPKRVSLTWFKTVLALETATIEDASRGKVYELLDSGIVFRALANNELLTEIRPVLARLDVAFDSSYTSVPKFATIPAGTFLMGTAASDAGLDRDETPQHQVTFSKAFEMQTTEVTQAQWVTIMGANPSQFATSEHCPEVFTTINNIPLCPNNPVEQISWDDAKAFIDKLNAKADGYLYKLPTEAEWEYAARAGTTGAYAGDIDAMAWYDVNSSGMAHSVAQKQANAWGLFDMHGNVWEWTADMYDSYPDAPVTDPVSPSSGTSRIARGGGWYTAAQYCRSAFRTINSPHTRYHYLGFRLQRTSL